MKRSVLLVGGFVLAALLALAPDALAHGIVGREDLPIPRAVFGWAAAGVLVVSFIGLATLWPTPKLEQATDRRVLRVPFVLEVLAGLVGVFLFGVVVWAGLDGQQSSAANFAPYFVLVLFWVGVPVLSILLGDLFRPFNPWRAIGRFAGWLGKRVAGSSLPEPLPYPDRLGRWPAVAGLLLFASYELVYATPSDPSSIAIAALIYAAIQLVGMAMYGVEPWERRGDGLAVYFGLIASMAPLHWKDRAVSVRPMFSGLTKLAVLPGTVALLAVGIGTTTFDGMRENQWWTDLALDIQNAVEDLGLSATRGLELAYLLGMLAVVAICWGLYRLGVQGMKGVDRKHSTTELAERFVHSLVPIAFAYLLAHYFSLLIYQGQAAWFLASDPAGRGWDIFGVAQSSIDYGVIGANGIWYVQVAALVIGHVAGLVLAHDRALVVFDDVKRATQSQYWMLAVMVTFTSLGLWLLSSAE